MFTRGIVVKRLFSQPFSALEPVRSRLRQFEERDLVGRFCNLNGWEVFFSFKI